MGVLIKIRKVGSTKDMEYYKVSAFDQKLVECYMGINKEKNMIYYYLTSDFSIPLISIDLDQPDKQISSLPGISKFIIGYSFLKAAKALKSSEFPDIMDYAA